MSSAGCKLGSRKGLRVVRSQRDRQGGPRELIPHIARMPWRKAGMFSVCCFVCLFFRGKGHLIEGIRETPKEDEAVVSMPAA